MKRRSAESLLACTADEDSSDDDFKCKEIKFKAKPKVHKKGKGSKTKKIKINSSVSTNATFGLNQKQGSASQSLGTVHSPKSKTSKFLKVKVKKSVPTKNSKQIVVTDSNSKKLESDVLNSDSKSDHTQLNHLIKLQDSNDSIPTIVCTKKLKHVTSLPSLSDSVTKSTLISISDESDDEFISDSRNPFQIFSPLKKRAEIFGEQKASNKTLKTKSVKMVKNSRPTKSCNLKNNLDSPAEKKTPKKTPTAVRPKNKKNLCRTPEKTTKIQDGYCPFCQVPFSALGIQSPNWHSMECMDLPLKTKQECERGINCNTTIASHYRKYKHTILASYRASKHHDDNNTIILDDEFNLEQNQSDIETDSVTDTFKQQSVETMDTFKQQSVETMDSCDIHTYVTNMDSCDAAGTEVATKPIEPDPNIAGSSVIDKKFALKNQILDESDTTTVIKNLDNNRPTLNNHSEHSSVDEIVSCVTVDDNNLYLANEDNYGIQTESDEDIFNVETPETPNFPFPKSMSDTNELNLQKPIQNLVNNLPEGFMVSENNESDDQIKNLEYFTKMSSDDGTLYTGTANTPLKSDSSVNVTSGPAKQTSLFSFFNTKSLKFKNEETRKLKFVENDPKPTNKRKSGTNVKSDAWGSLKRTTSKPVEETKHKVEIKTKKEQPTTIKPEEINLNQQGVNENKGRRKYFCPFYKKIPESGITVDAFRYGIIPGCTAYILTHFHYDHYSGLTRKFTQPIYCSQITGNLVENKLKVDPQYINKLPLNQPCSIGGVEVILREANHCPGAVIIFLRLPSGRLVLHTGDFRAHPTMEVYPELRDNQIQDLYLDTTYCDPNYAFPYQQDVINCAIKIARKALETNAKTCIVCGTYTIGKERVFKAIAKAINSKVCVKKDKKNILDCLEDQELDELITLNPLEASVHVLPMKLLNFNSLCDYLDKYKQFTSILVFEPTGWTHSNKVISLDHLQPKYSRNAITHYGIPYSEHSSYLELKRFVQFLKPSKILPTVNNGNPASRHKMEELFASWLREAEDMSPRKNIPQQSVLNKWLQ